MDKKTDPKAPVGFTIDGVVGMAGGSNKVAEACGITQQGVNKWTHIPRWHARTVAIMAGLPLAIVRPDMVYEKAEAAHD